MIPAIQSNAREFNAAFQQYAAANLRTPAEVVVKQAGEFNRFLRIRLKDITPAKGSIREDRARALEAGEGVKVRPSIIERLMARRGIAQRIKGRGYVFGSKQRGTVRSGGKRLNFQALAIKAEVNLRERGIGFVRHSTSFRGLAQARAQQGSQRKLVLDRYRRYLSSVGLRLNDASPSALFSWGGNRPSGDVAKVLTSGRGQQAVADALLDARDNMLVYVQRKLAQNAARTVGRVR
jgi:hypothetical protein